MDVSLSLLGCRAMSLGVSLSLLCCGAMFVGVSNSFGGSHCPNLYSPAVRHIRLLLTLNISVTIYQSERCKNSKIESSAKAL